MEGLFSAEDSTTLMMKERKKEMERERRRQREKEKGLKCVGEGELTLEIKYHVLCNCFC